MEFTDSGCNKIVSSINNLHPEKHRDLDEVVEKTISQTILLWNKSLEDKHFSSDRNGYKVVEYGEHSEPEPQYPGEHWDSDSPEWDDFDEDAWDELYDGWRPVLLYFQNLESSNPTKAGMRTGLTSGCISQAKGYKSL